MRGAGRAMTWALWRRHRHGFAAIGAFIVFVGVARAFVLGARPAGSDVDTGIAFSSIVPLTCAVLYVLVVFTHGLEGDLAGRDSLYPRRMFSLPVSTRALVAWPLSSGAATMALLWVASAVFVLRPSGFAVPVVWPAVLLMVFLAWMAVVLWTPTAIGGARMALAVLLVIGMDAAGVLGLTKHPGDGLMLAILLPQLPAAFLLAEAAVARARANAGGDAVAAGPGAASALPDGGRRFRTPAHALGWLEWGQHGRSLPVWVAIVVPLELALLFIPGTDTRVVLVATLAGVLVTPAVLAAFVAPSARRVAAERERGAMSSFLATRPVSTAALVSAKMGATVRSTFVAWAIVVVLTPVALSLSGTLPRAREVFDADARVGGGARAVALFAMVGAWLVLATWRQLVQGLYLAGRGWWGRASVAAAVAMLIAIVPIAQWVLARPGVVGVLWSAIPLMLAVVACAKVAIACVVATRLDATGALNERAMLIAVACWLACVGAVYGVLAWMFDTPHVPRYVLVLIAIVVIPVARLGAAPLALVRARHG